MESLATWLATMCNSIKSKTELERLKKPEVDTYAIELGASLKKLCDHLFDPESGEQSAVG